MSEIFSLKGKTALLTGAAGFFGGYFAEALLRAGARVILVDNNEEKLKGLVAQLDKLMDWDFPVGLERLCPFPVDQYDRDAANRVFSKIASGGVDVLINNAFDFSPKTGFNCSEGRLENTTINHFMTCLEAGAGWAFQCSQILGLAMKQQGGGSIINICSMYDYLVPSPALYQGTVIFNPPGYPPAKAALLGLTRSFAMFLAPEVRVNAISPGAIPNLETKSDNAPAKNDPVLSRLISQTPLARVGHPRDLVGTLIFLASDASSFITGQNIVVDGGITVGVKGDNYGS